MNRLGSTLQPSDLFYLTLSINKINENTKAKVFDKGYFYDKIGLLWPGLGSMDTR